LTEFENLTQKELNEIGERLCWDLLYWNFSFTTPFYPEVIDKNIANIKK